MRNNQKQTLTPTTDTANTLLEPLRDDHAAAPMLGVSPATLRKSRVSGTLLGLPTPVFLKMGKTIRYRDSDLKAWLNQFSTFANTAEAKRAASNQGAA